MEESNLPDEIWHEILSPFPIKSLLQFRSVSPSWRDLIDSPDFARKHLTRRFPQNTHILCSEKKTCVIRCIDTFELTAALDPPFIDPISVKYWSVVSSIDGLFMIRTSLRGQPNSTEYVLWNPSIKKSRKLPPSPTFSTVDYSMEVSFGFGFDPSLQDYKYVRLVINGKGHVLLVQIYTLGTNSWRSIVVEECPCRVHLFSDLRSFCRRGVLYALAWGDGIFGPQCLFSFDLSSEEFASTKLPVTCFDNEGLVMMNGEDSVVLVDGLGCEDSTVWVMETDFQSLIWTHRYTFTARVLRNRARVLLDGIQSVLYLKKNGELVLLFGEMVTSYNIETGEEKIF